MIKSLDRIFTDKYANHEAIGDNFILLGMYRFFSPFAVLLHRMRFTPDQITTGSLLMTMLAFVALAFDKGWVLFSILWWLAVLLDFCDGTVARMGNSVSKKAFRYDHMSDLFKIFLLFLGTAIRYDDYMVWLMSMMVLFSFMYFNLLNQILADIYRRTGAQRGKPAASGNMETPTLRNRERYRIIAWIVQFPRLYHCLRGLYSALITITGHSLLLFFLLPHGKMNVIWLFSYLIAVSLYGIASRIRILLSLAR